MRGLGLTPGGTRLTPWAEGVGLLAVLLLAFWVGMSPHWSDPYPMHVDEWFALGYTQEMLASGSLTYPSPYGDEVVLHHPEVGFHLIVAGVKSATGLSLTSLYRIAPGVVSALLALLAWAVGRRWGIGLGAGLLTVLVPTSVRTLGPQFFVPVSVALVLSLAMAGAVLSASEDRRSWRWTLVTVLVAVGAMLTHPPSFAVALVLTGGFILADVVGVRRPDRRGVVWGAATLGILALLLLAFLLGWQMDLTQETLASSEVGVPDVEFFYAPLQGFFGAYGLPGLLLALLGLWTVLTGRGVRPEELVFPGLALLLMAFLLVVYPRYFLGPAVLYERGWLFLALSLGFLGAYGLRELAPLMALAVERVRVAGLRLRGGALALGVTALVLTLALWLGPWGEARRAYAGFYHMVDDRLTADFVWMGRRDVDDRVVVMEPTLAWAYPPVAGPGRRVLGAVTVPFRARWAEEVRLRLRKGDFTPEWLRKRNVQFLYTCLAGGPACGQVNGWGLHQVRPGVFLVPRR